MSTTLPATKTRAISGEARDRALAAARNLTVFFPEARVHAVIKAAAEGTQARWQPRLATPAKHTAQRTGDDQRNASGADMSAQLLAQLR